MQDLKTLNARPLRESVRSLIIDGHVDSCQGHVRASAASTDWGTRRTLHSGDTVAGGQCHHCPSFSVSLSSEYNVRVRGRRSSQADGLPINGRDANALGAGLRRRPRTSPMPPRRPDPGTRSDFVLWRHHSAPRAALMSMLRDSIVTGVQSSPRAYAGRDQPVFASKWGERKVRQRRCLRAAHGPHPRRREDRTRNQMGLCTPAAPFP